MIIKVLFFLYIALSAFLVLKNYKLNKFLLFLVILGLTPWFVIFLKTPTQSWWLGNPLGISLTVNTSTDYLFFQGSENIEYSTQDAGYFYLWQLPLIILGFYTILVNANKLGKYLFIWFLIGLIFASIFSLSTFSASFLYFVPLQMIFFTGLNALWLSFKKMTKFQKILVGFYFLLGFYEVIVFFHILLVHWPKKILLG